MLLAARAAVQASRGSRADALLALGLPQSAIAVRHAARRMATLFCYPGADFSALFEALACSGPWTIAIPEGVAPQAQAMARAGHAHATAAGADASPIAIERFDWLSPADYDRLLGALDEAGRWPADVLHQRDDEQRRADWEAHRDFLIAVAIRDNLFRRPGAFWRSP